MISGIEVSDRSRYFIQDESFDYNIVSLLCCKQTCFLKFVSDINRYSYIKKKSFRKTYKTSKNKISLNIITQKIVA